MSGTIPDSIFITGAASGIGQATAHFFAGKGWRVGLADRNATALDRLMVELGPEASAFPLDVLDRSQLSAALSAFSQPSGALKAMFNSAGILEMKPFAETPVERLHAIIDVNVKGIINSVSAALPFLRAHGDARVVTMGSVSGLYGIPELAVYSASKFAVRGLTEALNIELERDGIWVTDVMVAYVKTPMVEAAASKAKSVEILGVNVLPENVAETVWNAVRGRQVHWFVTPGDAGVAAQIDATPWESRRELVKSITGY